MIPIEYLWYTIGAFSVPVFILIYLKALKRNREDKVRVAMRRKRFERTMKSPLECKSNTGKIPATERIAEEQPTDRENGWRSRSKIPWRTIQNRF